MLETRSRSGPASPRNSVVADREEDACYRGDQRFSSFD